MKIKPIFTMSEYQSLLNRMGLDFPDFFVKVLKTYIDKNNIQLGVPYKEKDDTVYCTMRNVYDRYNEYEWRETSIFGILDKCIRLNAESINVYEEQKELKYEAFMSQGFQEGLNLHLEYKEVLLFMLQLAQEKTFGYKNIDFSKRIEEKMKALKDWKTSEIKRHGKLEFKKDYDYEADRNENYNWKKSCR